MAELHVPALPAFPTTVPRDLTAPVLLGFAALTLSLCVSANLLFLEGIPYDAPGGVLPEKLHPSSYCAGLALLLLLWRQGGSALLRACPGACVFLGMMLLCLAFQVVTGGSDRLVVYLESFMPAGALAIVFAHASAPARRLLVRWLVVLLLLNVVIALIETVQQRNWIPVFLVDRELIVRAAEFRPSALYDHPLTGAMLSMVGLFLVLAMNLAPWRRVGLAGAFAVGLLAFGGRAALAGSAGMLGLLGVRVAWRRIAAGRLRLPVLCLALAAIALAVALAMLLLAVTPIGERIAARLYWDDSAAARGVQWRILGMLDTGEWLFGVPRERLELLVANLGLRYPFVAVENFWLLIFLDLGLFGFPLFLIGMATLLASAARRAGGSGRVLLFAVMAVASTSNSLGRKSNILTVLIPAVIATAGFAERRADV
jgi:hypothetical protein